MSVSAAPTAEQSDPEDLRTQLTGTRSAPSRPVLVDRRAGGELPDEQDGDRRDHADAVARDGDREHDDHAHDRAAPEPDRLASGLDEGAQALLGHEQEREGEQGGERGGPGQRAEDADAVAQLGHHRHLNRARDAGDDREEDGEHAHAARDATTLRVTLRRMIRVFVLYSDRPDPDRYEQHAELCRQVPGATFRHGQVFGAPMGEPAYAYYAEWEFPDMRRVQGAARTSPEFMATGKDAMEMGVPLRSPLRGRSE